MVQQYHWVPNQYVSGVLNGNLVLCPPNKLKSKPEGIWISPASAWADFGTDDAAGFAINNRTPLEAHIVRGSEILDIGSYNDIVAICNNINIAIPSPLSDDSTRYKESHTRFFRKVMLMGYDGIHMTKKAAHELDEVHDIFTGWDIDSTVVFEASNLKFELMTKNELHKLGWDMYAGVITKESNNPFCVSAILDDVHGIFKSHSHKLSPKLYAELSQLLNEIANLPDNTEKDANEKEKLLNEFDKNFKKYI